MIGEFSPNFQPPQPPYSNKYQPPEPPYSNKYHPNPNPNPKNPIKKNVPARIEQMFPFKLLAELTNRITDLDKNTQAPEFRGCGDKHVCVRRFSVLRKRVLRELCVKSMMFEKGLEMGGFLGNCLFEWMKMIVRAFHGGGI